MKKTAEIIDLRERLAFGAATLEMRARFARTRAILAAPTPDSVTRILVETEPRTIERGARMECLK